MWMNPYKTMARQKALEQIFHLVTTPAEHAADNLVSQKDIFQVLMSDTTTILVLIKIGFKGIKFGLNF